MRLIKNTTLRLIIILSAAFFSSGSQASLITYGFEVTTTVGPLAGTSSVGSFTFDSSIIPIGGGVLLQTDLLTDLDFTWNSIVYDETTATTGSMVFSVNGDLLSILFGSDCDNGGCVVFSGTDDWSIYTDFVFVYSLVGASSAYVDFYTAHLTGCTSGCAAVPEPSILGLMMLGFVSLVWSMRRRFER